MFTRFRFVCVLMSILGPATASGQSIECESSRAAESACSFDSDCDSAAMRDLWQPGASTPMMTLRIGFVVFTDDGGSNPAVTSTKLNAQFSQLNLDFEPYRIQFDWINGDEPEDYLVEETDYNRYYDYCFPTPSGFIGCDCPLAGDATCDPGDYVEAAMMSYGVTQTALDASASLNVFLAVQNANVSDFPWYDDVDTFLHGVRMVGSYLGDNNDCSGVTCQSITHEVGHILGLFHTHEGTGSSCTDCVEPYECDGTCADEECDEYGDLCCDTAATGTHSCEGFDNIQPRCSTGDWQYVDESNYMGYSGDGCWDHFTPQQVSRMHCWVCNAHPDWIDSPDCNLNGKPDVCEITRGDKTDCDEDGIPDEDCDVGGACCLSGESDDCIKTPTSACCDAANGLNWYGLGTKCRDIDCFEGPMGPQSP